MTSVVASLIDVCIDCFSADVSELVLPVAVVCAVCLSPVVNCVFWSLWLVVCGECLSIDVVCVFRSPMLVLCVMCSPFVDVCEVGCLSFCVVCSLVNIIDVILAIVVDVGKV